MTIMTPMTMMEMVLHINHETIHPSGMFFTTSDYLHSDENRCMDNCCK